MSAGTLFWMLIFGGLGLGGLLGMNVVLWVLLALLGPILHQ